MYIKRSPCVIMFILQNKLHSACKLEVIEVLNKFNTRLIQREIGRSLTLLLCFSQCGICVHGEMLRQYGSPVTKKQRNLNLYSLQVTFHKQWKTFKWFMNSRPFCDMCWRRGGQGDNTQVQRNGTHVTMTGCNS